MNILILATGGTLDKDYNTLTGKLGFTDTHLPKLLGQANLTLPIQTQVVLQKDSLEMTDADRQTVSLACETASELHIVIAHGTDTLDLTAKALENNPKLNQKTIVLTGAMRPFQLGESDAAFNMGAALMAVQLAPPGVYIAMNGHLFNPHQVQKNHLQGVFESITSSHHL
jgi:L-asparaginase